MFFFPLSLYYLQVTVDKDSIGFDLLELEHAAYLAVEDQEGGGRGRERPTSTGEPVVGSSSEGKSNHKQVEDKEEDEKEQEEEEEEEEEGGDDDDDEEEEEEEEDDYDEEATLADLKLPNQPVSKSCALIEELPPPPLSDKLLNEPPSEGSAVNECTDLMKTVCLND